MQFKLGELVSSKAGRDTGRKLVIVGIIDEKFVLVSDGDLRKIEKPKKKKIKHVESCGIIIDSLNKKLENNMKVINAEIRKEIAKYVQDSKESLNKEG